jgi:hypothetical protein
MAVDQKITPSGSKSRVPPAPVTGPLKSPAPPDLAGCTLSKYEPVHKSRSKSPWGCISTVLQINIAQWGMLIC